jgi:glycosyltransferase involved in cell wall biosynthesis
MKIIVINKDNSERRPPVISVLFILSNLGYNITLITCNTSLKFNQMMKDKGIEIVVMPFYNSSSFIGKFIDYVKFRKHVFNYIDNNYNDENFLLWLIDAQTILALGKKLLSYRYILQIQELHEDSKLYLSKISNVIKSAELVFMPEYTRTFLYNLWFNLKQKPIVLPNKPYFLPSKDYFIKMSKKYLNKYPELINKKIIIYQGGISPVRMLDNLAKAILEMNDYVLLLLGTEQSFGYVNKLKKINKNVIHIKYISAPDYLAITRISHIGYICYEPKSLNNIFCAPNKVNEYSFCSLPMIANDIPGLKNIFNIYNPGIIVENVDEHSLKNAIFKIEKNYETFKNNSSKIFNSIDNESTISNNLKKLKF